MKVIVDNKIPYIREALSRLADEVIYLPGHDFTPDIIKDADALIIRTRTHCNRQLLEGSQVEVPVGSNQKNALTPMATVDTNNILFICGGAFPGLDDIIKERLKKRSTMGFNSHLKDEFDNDPDILSQVTTEDLRNFGMIPEFLGRLPVLVSLQGLTKELLMRILKEPKNAILKQYERLLALDEVKLVFEDDALEWIAERALEKDTGARALRAILEDFMMDIMYEIPKDPNIGSVVITRPYLEKKGGPRIEMRG